MSLRYGLLGMLAAGPASGYDLSRRFQEVVGPVWPAQHPKIYAELNRLLTDGLIEIDSQGPRRRKAYHITEAGLVEVRRWLSGDVDHALRLEPLLRSFFAWLLEPGEVRRQLDDEARRFEVQAEFFRDYARRKDRGEFGSSPQVESTRVALEGAIRLYDALAGWARWAQERAAPARRGSGQE